MKKSALLLLCIGLSGCAVAYDSYLPDGSKGYNIDCSGSMMTYTSCMQKAGDLCGDKGFQVFAADGSSTPVGFSNGSAFVNQYGGQAQSSSWFGSAVSRGMLVKCGKPEKHKK